MQRGTSSQRTGSAVSSSLAGSIAADKRASSRAAPVLQHRQAQCAAFVCAAPCTDSAVAALEGTLRAAKRGDEEWTAERGCVQAFGCFRVLRCCRRAMLVRSLLACTRKPRSAFSYFLIHQYQRLQAFAQRLQSFITHRSVSESAGDRLSSGHYCVVQAGCVREAGVVVLREARAAAATARIVRAAGTFSACRLQRRFGGADADGERLHTGVGSSASRLVAEQLRSRASPHLQARPAATERAVCALRGGELHERHLRVLIVQLREVQARHRAAKRLEEAAHLRRLPSVAASGAARGHTRAADTPRRTAPPHLHA